MHHQSQSKRHNTHPSSSSSSLHNLYAYENDQPSQHTTQSAPRGYLPHPYSTSPGKQSSTQQQMTLRIRGNGDNAYNPNYYPSQQASNSFGGAPNLSKPSSIPSPSPISSHRSAPRNKNIAHTQSQSQSQSQSIRPTHTNNRHSMSQHHQHPSHAHTHVHQQPSPSPSRYHNVAASPRSVHSAHSTHSHHSHRSAVAAGGPPPNMPYVPHPSTQTANSNHGGGGVATSNGHAHAHHANAPHLHPHHPHHRSTTPTGTQQHQQHQKQQQQQRMRSSGGGGAGAVPASSSTAAMVSNDPNLFKLQGILRIMKQEDADYQMVTLGTDLTKLGGLDLNCPEPEINHTFLSPWVERWDDSNKYATPKQYGVDSKPSQYTKFMTRYKDTTLFYIFYAMVNDKMQVYAAKELYQRNWCYHKGLQLWLHKLQSAAAATTETTANNAKRNKKTSSSSTTDAGGSSSSSSKEKTSTSSRTSTTTATALNEVDEQKLNDESVTDKAKKEEKRKLDDENAAAQDMDEEKVHQDSGGGGGTGTANNTKNGMTHKQLEDKAVTFMKTVNVKDMEYFDVLAWKTRHFASKFPLDWNLEKKNVLHEHALNLIYKECHECDTKNGRAH